MLQRGPRGEAPRGGWWVAAGRRRRRGAHHAGPEKGRARTGPTQRLHRQFWPRSWRTMPPQLARARLVN
jgi:hypothetical protein